MKILHGILATLLGLLGFSSCLKEDPDNPIICMYGTPTAHYVIKGKVVNPQGKGVSRVQVIVSEQEFAYAPRPGVILDEPRGIRPVHDTLYTDEQGKFETWQTYFPIDTIRYRLKINEDGCHPLYESDSLKVTFLKQDLSKGDGVWNLGKNIQEVKITLQPKKEDSHE